MRKYIVKSVSCTMLALLVTACTSLTPTATQPADTVSTVTQQAKHEVPSATLLPADTQTPLPTYTIQPTATNAPTRTASPTNTPLVGTPVPTLIPMEWAKLVSELMATNGGCDLPCWWGIHPGQEPTVDNINLVLRSPLNMVRESAWLFSRNFFNIKDYSATYIVGLDAGIINMIIINSTIAARPATALAEDWQLFSLQSVLSKYGKPTEVRSGYKSDANKVQFTLDILYEDRGIAINYWGYLEQTPDGPEVCPLLTNMIAVDLLLTETGDHVLYKKLITDWLRNHSKLAAPIQDASPMTLDDFYTTFKESPNVCFTLISK